MFLINTSETGYSYTQSTASVTQTWKSQEKRKESLLPHYSKIACTRLHPLRQMAIGLPVVPCYFSIQTIFTGSTLNIGSILAQKSMIKYEDKSRNLWNFVLFLSAYISQLWITFCITSSGKWCDKNSEWSTFSTHHDKRSRLLLCVGDAGLS